MSLLMTVELCYPCSQLIEKGCAECGVKTSDGYALYCVKCSEPLKEWVGLTDEEIGVLTVLDGLHDVETPLLADFVRAIEAKIQEKNTCR